MKREGDEAHIAKPQTSSFSAATRADPVDLVSDDDAIEMTEALQTIPNAAPSVAADKPPAAGTVVSAREVPVLDSEAVREPTEALKPSPALELAIAKPCVASESTVSRGEHNERSIRAAEEMPAAASTSICADRNSTSNGAATAADAGFSGGGGLDDEVATLMLRY